MENLEFSSTKKLHFVISGSEMDKSYNLFLLLRSLSSLHDLHDKAYLSLVGKNKISETDRDNYQIRLTNVDEGSFSADLSVTVLSAIQVGLPFVTTVTPSAIWEIVKQGYQYLKFVLDGVQRGKTIHLEEGENNTVIVVKGDNNKITVNSQTIPFVKGATKDYQVLANVVDPEKGIERVQVGDMSDLTNDLSGINVEPGDKDLFKVSKTIEEESVKFKAKIYRLDGYDCNGKLSITHSEDEDIVRGETYNFDLLDKGDLDKCHSYFMKEAQLTALKEISFNPSTLKRHLSRLKIISIKH